MKFLSMLGSAFAYFSIATVLAVAVVAVMMWQKGAFQDERVHRMWAALYGVEIESPQAKAAKSQEPVALPTYDEVLNKRALASLDLSLRESAVSHSLDELKNVSLKIQTERTRFDQLVTTFDNRIKQLEQIATDEAVAETQRTIEALPPKQAKQQLLKLLESKPSEDMAKPIDSVVSIVKAMPIEKRRKILSEFKAGDEEDKLAEILKEILRGAPDLPILREARDDARKAAPARPKLN
jgi:predicted enzyme involved in methoxymalonyl-ACP biosynthesis